VFKLGLEVLVVLSPSVVGAFPPTEEPRYEFPAINGKPWKTVFAWITETTGRPVTGVIPDGALVAYVCKPGKRYTINDIVDIVNGSLLAEQPTPYYLLRRERDFVVVPANKNIDCLCVPFHVEDLKKCPRTQLVSVIVPLTTLKPEEVCKAFGDTVTSVGSLQAMKPNSVLIRDTAAHVEFLVFSIRRYEAMKKSEVQRLLQGPAQPYFKMYAVGENARSITNDLVDGPFKPSPTCHIFAIGNGVIGIYALPEVHGAIAGPWAIRGKE
jgi:hypothetical protein